MDGNNSSRSSSSSTKRNHGDSFSMSSSRSFHADDGGGDFTALLLGLSQAHNGQVKELKLKLASLQRKYDRIYNGFQKNYDLAKESSKENIQLKEENARLKRRIAQLERKEKKPSESDSDQDGVEVHIANPANQACDDENEDTARSVRVNKLSKTKSSKKVRYSELDRPPTKASKKEIKEPTKKGRHKDDFRTLSIRHNGKVQDAEMIDDDNDQQSDSHETNIVKRSILVDDLIGQGIGEHDVSPAKILAPETCHPSSEMDSSVDLDDDLYAGGDNTRRTRVMTVPETLAVAGNFVDSELSDESDLDLPTCASTPRNVTQSLITSTIRRSKDEAHGHGSVVSRKAYELPSQSNHYEESNQNHLTVIDNDETYFVSQDHRRRSLPKSESQYPVDFSTTQAPSPTFCGGKDADNDEDDDGEEVKIVLDIEKASTYRELCTKPKTPLSFGANDSSCQSEASLLLLQVPQEMSSVSTPEWPQENNSLKCLMDKKVDNEVQHVEQPTTSVWKPNPRKRKNLLDESVEDEDYEKEDERSSRRKLDEGKRVNENDETTFDMNVPDKENSPPEDHPSSPKKVPPSISISHKPSKQKLDMSGKLIITKPSPKGTFNKVLKQSKLSPSMFQTKSTTHNSLIAQYNGNGKVNLDSQRDDSLAKAIELSILENIDTFKSNQDVVETRRENCDFKIPSLPNVRKSPRERNNKDRLDDCVSPVLHGVDGMKTGDESCSLSSRSDLHLKSNAFKEGVVFDVIDDDRNRGAIKSKLSRKKRRTTSSSEKSTAFVAVKNKEKRAIEEIHEIDEDDEDDGNNSCADLFEDDAGDTKENEVSIEHVAIVTNDKDITDADKTILEQSMEEKLADQSISMKYAQDFDRLPDKSAGPSYKYVDIVRKKEERQRLKAFDCKQCEAFYKDMKLTDEERQERMKACSRHRAHFSPPSTPEHYWSVGFPDTQTCLQRGYLQISDSPDKSHRKRATNKYKQLF